MRIISRVLGTLIGVQVTLTLFGAVTAPALHETSLNLVVEAVHDGDTFSTHLGGLVDKVRLLGIDAPELKQPKWGKLAQEKLAGLVLRQTVRVEVDEVHPRDAYGRLVGYVYYHDVLVQREMLVSGLAVAKAYGKPPRMFDMLVTFEQAAKARHSGVWSDPTFVSPDTFRHTHGVGR